jgi:GTP cyclohydrolase I
MQRNPNEISDKITNSSHIDKKLENPTIAESIAKDSQNKIEAISYHFQEIMKSLGMDLTDDSLSGTPNRFAKMYVNDLFKGLNPEARPKITTFANRYGYREMLIEKNMKVVSCCEHHFMPFIGKAHVAYIPNEKVIGLSKINRLVNYYSRRPQTQERLTLQIADDIKNTLGTESVAVLIETKHLCVLTRGVEDHGSSTVTSDFSGEFLKAGKQEKFLANVGSELMKGSSI